MGDDPRSGLEHVLWLGGSTGAAKSAVAETIAATRGFEVYSTDRAIEVHAAGPSAGAPRLRAFLELTPDERWLAGNALTQFDAFPWFAGERFGRIAEDLRQSSPTRPVLAEGFRLLPRLVQPLMATPRSAVWLISTADFRRRVFAGRPPERQFWRRTSDPDAAFELLLARDAVFAGRLHDEARALGLKVLVVDGSQSLADLATEIADCFGLN